MNEQWKERMRPPRLERRYLFDDYDSLRDFLDQAAELSERESYYPDISFGRDYVNITIHVEDGAESLSESHHRFAEQLDALINDSAN
jgi:4a-hydroxytetrahydrobiopterin dehydratase